MLKWVEPGNYGEHRTVTISEEDAIKFQKVCAKIGGHTYVRDEDALLDFIAVHWAWYECHFHDFWCQIAIACLYTFIKRSGHDICCDGYNIDNIPCDDCGAGY